MLAVGPVVAEVSEAFGLYWNSRGGISTASVFRRNRQRRVGSRPFRKASDRYRLPQLNRQPMPTPCAFIQLDSLQQIAELGFSWGALGSWFMINLPKVDAKGGEGGDPPGAFSSEEVMTGLAAN